MTEQVYRDAGMESSAERRARLQARKLRKKRRRQIRLFWIAARFLFLITVVLCAVQMLLLQRGGADGGSGTMEGMEADMETQVEMRLGGVDVEGTDTEAWKLILVNPWNPLPADYEITVTQLRGGQAVDERCYADLQDMMDDCRAAGLSPVICSSYRTREKQEALFYNKTAEWMAQGYSEEEAKKKTATSIAIPGTSEHELGLALDIVDESNQLLDESQEDTAVQQWLMENCWRYGFILRYPDGMSEITGIIYEPWHYRYVGKEVAAEIWERGICLEEYLEDR